MNESVRSNFNSFTKTFEGRVAWMYLDIKGLVTVAVGNLIDPVDNALSLPFVHKADNTPATKDEIRAEWTSLKAKTDLATKGYKACESITNLRLTDPGMDSLVDSKLTLNETALKTSFPNWEQWPADAQLGVLSMAWALGAGFAAQWPKFAAAAKAGDWTTASSNCVIDATGNPGVVKRNDADVKLFKNAAAVVAGKLDASKLYYPADASTTSPNGQTASSSQNTTSSTPSQGTDPSTSSQATDSSTSSDSTDPSTSSDSTDSSSSDQTDAAVSDDASSSSDSTDSSSSDQTDETDAAVSDDASSSSDSTDSSSSDQSDETDAAVADDASSSDESDETDAADSSQSTDPDPATESSDSSSSDTVDTSDSSADEAASVGSG